MDLPKAKRIIADNYLNHANSLCYLMNEECEFSAAAFWEYYDAIAFVTRNSIKNETLSAQIGLGYQKFLKEIICHFAPNDAAVMKHFPENYNDYIERLDFAVRAYFEGTPELLNDALFDLQKQTEDRNHADRPSISETSAKNHCSLSGLPRT